MSSGHGSNSSGIILRRADGTAMTKSEVMVIRRGYFKSLPVLCSNDLVHGSWWMVWGSLITAVFAVVPLIQNYESFYHQHDDILPAVDFQVTWSLLVFSGGAFMFGSLAFVRAFEEPPVRPLFYYYKHFQTDELLGAWLFLVGTVPAIPYTLVYFIMYPNFTYFGSCLASFIFVIGTLLFVFACYPSEKKHKNYVLPLFIKLVGPRIWVLKHLANDWLAGTWFFFWANFLFMLGSFFLLMAAMVITDKAEQIFIWLSSTVSSALFLLGSAYFVAGSYPHAQQFYYATGRGQLEQDPSTLSRSSISGTPRISRETSLSNLESASSAATTTTAGIPVSHHYQTSNNSSRISNMNTKVLQSDTVSPLHSQSPHTPPSSATTISSGNNNNDNNNNNTVVPKSPSSVLLSNLAMNNSSSNNNNNNSLKSSFSGTHLDKTQSSTTTSNNININNNQLLLMGDDEGDENREDDDVEEEEEDRRGLLSTQLNPLHTITANSATTTTGVYTTTTNTSNSAIVATSSPQISIQSSSNDNHGTS